MPDESRGGSVAASNRGTRRRSILKRTVITRCEIPSGTNALTCAHCIALPRSGADGVDAASAAAWV
jgi:hypothetical protein